MAPASLRIRFVNRERRKVAIVVQQQMELDGSFPPPILRPVEHRCTQRDGARIQAEQSVLEAKLPLLLARLASRCALTLRQKLVKDRLIQLPRSVFVGVGQSRAGGRPRQTQML